MSKSQHSYFAGKHPWSLTKDHLLSCYLTPFFQKTYRFSRDGIVYVDAFAGAGKFEDGTLGSPLIALSKVQAAARKNGSKQSVQFVLAEANDGSRDSLLCNLRSARGNSRYIKDPIVCRGYSEAMQAVSAIRVCGSRKPSTVFYYVDPFGIKDLRIDDLLHSPNMNHTEALVNFNGVGFIRDACAARKIDCAFPPDVEILDDGFDESVRLDERCKRLSSFIGSDDWVDIVQLFHEGQFDFWRAEYEVARLFCCNARSAYRYVTNMPIKDMSKSVEAGGLLKYRMIHMTNSADGCILMNDNMLNRNDEHQVLQLGLFKVDVDGRDVRPDVVTRRIDEIIEQLPVGKEIKMGEIAASIISSCGVFDKTTQLLRINIGPLPKSGRLERVVKKTKTGKAKQSFSPKDAVFRAY